MVPWESPRGAHAIDTADHRSVLHVADRGDDAARLAAALDEAAVPYDTGLMAEPPARVVFFVDDELLPFARAVVQETLGRGATPDHDGSAGPPRFPWAEVTPLAGLVAGQLLLVLWSRGPFPFAGAVLERGALAAGGTALEPWRLVTSLLVHADPGHVLSNALGLFAFGVPLVGWFGLRRAASIWLVAGIGGGLAALSLAEAGTRIVGSSGAVSGLFGAWVVIALARARRADLPGRARIRTLGVALLVLPSLLTPTGASGQAISVESHVGGLVTGMALGAALAGGLVARVRARRVTDPVPFRDPRFDDPAG